MSDSVLSAAVLALRSKTVYSGVPESSAVVQWLWTHISTSLSDAQRATLHRALFGEHGGATIREIRIMSAGEDAGSLITCNAVVHVLLLPIFPTEAIFRSRFDESLAARFKQRRSLAPPAPAVLPAPRRISVAPSAAASSLSPTAPAAPIVRRVTGGASTVRQNMAKFEAAGFDAAAATQRNVLSLQQRVQMDLSASRVAHTAAPSRAMPSPSPAATAAAPAAAASPKAAPRVAATPIAPPSPVAPRVPPRVPRDAEAAAPVTEPTPSESVSLSADGQAAPSAAAVRPPVPLSKPPLRRSTNEVGPPPKPATLSPRHSSLAPAVEADGGAKTFSEALASSSAATTAAATTKKVKRRSSAAAEATAGGDTDEVAAQRAAQQKAQRLEAEKSAERARKLQVLSERERPIFELITTEEDYCRWLVVQTCFIDSLRRHRVLTGQEIDETFPRIEALKEATSSLVRAFRAADDGLYARVGEVFCAAFDVAAQTAMFESVAAQETAAARLQQLLAENEPFAQRCRAAKLDSEMALTDIASLQIKPFQRLTKYPLLFKSILAATPAAFADYAHLQKALDVVTGVLRRVDELRDSREKRERAIQLERRIAGATASGSASSSEPGAGGAGGAAAASDDVCARMLLHEGEVTLIDDSGGGRDVHLFLFSDVIMFARTTSKFSRKVMGDKSFRMHDEISLTSSTCSVSESRRPNLTHAFDVCVVEPDRSKRRPRKVTLVCSTAVELSAWIFAITAAIDAVAKLKPAIEAPAAAAAAAAAGTRKLVKKSKQRQIDGAVKRSPERAVVSSTSDERALLAARKNRDGLVKLAKFYSDERGGAAEVVKELAECDAEIARLEQALRNNNKQSS